MRCALARAITDTAAFRRNAAALGLVSAAVLMTVSIALSPEFPDGSSERLAAIQAAGTGGTVSALTFGLAQLPFLVGVLGIGHLLRRGAPLLSKVATSIAAVGTFGHIAFAGVSMVYLEMAADEANRATYARLLEQVESGPAVAFMAMGLLGTVVGILLLAIGLWRADVPPRWVAPTLVLFLVVEFVGSALAQWTSQLAAVLQLVAFTALALTIWRTDEADWARPEGRRASVAQV